MSAYLESLRDQMRDGDAMLFLDGLDEVPDASDEIRREQIKTLVELLRDTYPRCRIVVTSRPYAYTLGGWGLDEFGQVDLVALRPYRLEELALKLFTVVLGAEQAQEEAERFRQRVEQDVDEELRSSPLFFTLMAAIWLGNRHQPAETRLPGKSRSAIYRACVNTLIARWTRKDADGGHSPLEAAGLDETQLRQLLEALAYQVHSESDPNSRDDAVFESGRIMTIARRDLKLKGVNYDLLLEMLAQRAGVVYERAPEEYQFAHRSFQEHLATRYLVTHDYPALAAHCVCENPALWQNVFELLPDEAKDLWALVDRLTPDENTALPDSAGDSQWYRIAYAARLLLEHLPETDRWQKLYRPLLREPLAKLLTLGALPPAQRAEAGRNLAVIGDPRQGVGVITQNGVTLPDIAWCEIPAEKAGETFVFGEGEDEQRLAIPYTYWIARYPVTYAQYKAFVDAGGYSNEDLWTKTGWAWKKDTTHPEYWRDPRWHITNHPVIGVTWYEAYAFCQWLDSVAAKPGPGLVIRLATQAEWEKAARYPHGRAYPWGSEYISGYANIDEMARYVGEKAGPHYLGRTTPVGMYPQGANPAHGAHDLSGNVWEWCVSKWAGSYTFQEDNTPEGDIERVLRGGSWNDTQDNARAAYLYGSLPDVWLNDNGFRVVCGAAPS